MTDEYQGKVAGFKAVMNSRCKAAARHRQVGGKIVSSTGGYDDQAYRRRHHDRGRGKHERPRDHDATPDATASILRPARRCIVAVLADANR